MSRRFALLVIVGFLTLIISASLSGFADSNTVPQSRVADITATPPTPVPTITSTPTATATNAPTATSTPTPTTCSTSFTPPQLKGTAGGKAGDGYVIAVPANALSVSMSWTSDAKQRSIRLYQGDPFGGATGFLSDTAPPAGAIPPVASGAGTTVSRASQALTVGQTYRIFLHDDDNGTVNTSANGVVMQYTKSGSCP